MRKIHITIEMDDSVMRFCIIHTLDYADFMARIQHFKTFCIVNGP